MIKPPKSRRRFKSDLDELDYLSEKIGYWLHVRGNEVVARRFTSRFAELLRRNRRRLSGSIVVHLYSALLHDLRGDLRSEIREREEAIRLIRRLHSLAEPEALVGYGFDDLVDELIILAAVYFDAGRIDDAAATSEDAVRTARAHGIAIDERELPVPPTCDSSGQHQRRA